MGKPAHLSNKRWNKKFQRNVRKFQNLANMSNQSRMNKSSQSGDSLLSIGRFKQWVIFQCFLSLIKVVPLAVNQLFTKLSSTFTKMNSSETTEIDKANLEARVNNLEKTLEEYAERMKMLQQEVEQSKMLIKRNDAINNQQSLYGLNSQLQIPPPPSLVQSSVNPNVPTSFPISAPPPPPPPPPPPLMSMFTVQKPLVINKTSSTVKKPVQRSLSMRPAISVEDIMSVRLKKTPSISQLERSKVSTPSSDFLPRISLEAIRSVKLKKTSLMKGPSPVKAKSPKNKMIVRHALRRLPINLTPVGTPKGGRSVTAVMSDQDDMTPVLTRALLKRFDAFQMSPDENKENDMQFA